MGGTHPRPGGRWEVGARWPCMAALSLCLFDIWPEHTARMKGEMGVFISCLAEYTRGIKKKVKERQKEGK